MSGASTQMEPAGRWRSVSSEPGGRGESAR
jgi:hypothetical protein